MIRGGSCMLRLVSGVRGGLWGIGMGGCVGFSYLSYCFSSVELGIGELLFWFHNSGW